jgi:hypothetical protein
MAAKEFAGIIATNWFKGQVGSRFYMSYSIEMPPEYVNYNVPNRGFTLPPPTPYRVATQALIHAVDIVTKNLHGLWVITCKNKAVVDAVNAKKAIKGDKLMARLLRQLDPATLSYAGVELEFVYIEREPNEDYNFGFKDDKDPLDIEGGEKPSPDNIIDKMASVERRGTVADEILNSGARPSRPLPKAVMKKRLVETDPKIKQAVEEAKKERMSKRKGIKVKKEEKEEPVKTDGTPTLVFPPKPESDKQEIKTT